MARIRSIKPEFFTSLTVGGLNPLARLTFIGLWTYCDDDGRGFDDVRLIRAAVWPVDDRKLKEVESDLVMLANAGLIIRYEVAGKRYLAITNWSEHQRISHPKPKNFPPPPSRTNPESFPNHSGTPPERIANAAGTVPPRVGGHAPGEGSGKGREGSRNGKELNIQSSLVSSLNPLAAARAPPK